MTDIFTKHWGDRTGYTLKEAERKLYAVNEAHGVYKPDSKWNPAQLISDERGGYKVVITTK